MTRPFIQLAALLGLAAGLAACSRSSGSQADIDQLTERVEKLEAMQQRFAEIDEFLTPIMAQQKAQREQEEASEPDPDARFAVTITGNAFDGPAGAAVTIIEAFDFA